MKRRVRELTYRNRGRAFEQVISELNQFLRGWLHYFRLARLSTKLQSLDEWIRRRLRCYRLKQRKRSYSIASWIISLGVKATLAWQLAMSSKGWWRLSRNPVINQALSNAWFKEQGLYSLRENYALLNLPPEPPYATNACTVVCEDGGREASSYSILKKEINMIKFLVMFVICALNIQLVVADEVVELPDNVKQWVAEAETGNINAQLELGKFYYNGYPQSLRDSSKSFYWYERAAKKDNLEAQRKVAEYYQTGTGVKGDLKNAEFWLLKAADKGDLSSQADLGLYYMGDVSAGGPHKALPWLRAASSKLHGDSIYLMADCYESKGASQASLAAAAALYNAALKGSPNLYGSFLKTLTNEAKYSLEELDPEHKQQALLLAEQMLQENNLLKALDNYTKSEPCAW